MHGGHQAMISYDTYLDLVQEDRADHPPRLTRRANSLANLSLPPFHN